MKCTPTRRADGHCVPGVGGWVVAASIGQERAIETAPNEHLRSSPCGSVTGTGRRRARSRYYVPCASTRIVASPILQIAAIETAPDQHLLACPNGSMRVARRYIAILIEGRPTISIRVIAAAVGGVATVIVTAPDDHLPSRPHRRMIEPA